MSYRYGYNRYNDPDYYWKADENKIKRDFMNYANKSKKIEEEGYKKMGKTLGIDIYTDVFMTYFLFKCGATTIDYITEAEYMTGLKALKCNTLNDVKNKMTKIKESWLTLDNNEDFRNFYLFLFSFNVQAKGAALKTKSLPYEIVEVYFKGLFFQFNIINEFLVFLKGKNVGLKWDEWNTFLDFLKDKGATFPKDYEYGTAYYPSICDEFYIWYCKKHNIKIPDEEEEDF